MIKKKRLHLALAAVLWPAIGYTLNSNDKHYDLLAGDYFESSYISTLLKTRSPLTAFEEDLDKGIAQSAQVYCKDTMLEINFNYNWHESERVNLARTGNIRWEGQSDERSITVISRRSFRVSNGKTSKLYSLYPYNALFNSVIAGNYVDKNGHPYTFLKRGVARFPHDTFHFKIGLDQIFDHYDYFERKSPMQRIAFRWKGEKLSLYAVKTQNVEDGPGYGEIDFSHRIAVLEKSHRQ